MHNPERTVLCVLAFGLATAAGLAIGLVVDPPATAELAHAEANTVTHAKPVFTPLEIGVGLVVAVAIGGLATVYGRFT